VIVHESLADPESTGHVDHPGGVEATLADLLDGRGEDLLPPYLDVLSHPCRVSGRAAGPGCLTCYIR